MYLLVSFRCPVLLHLVSGTRLTKGQVWYILRTRYQVSHAQSYDYDTWYLVYSSTTSSAQAAGVVAYNDLVRLVPRILITLPQTTADVQQYRARKKKPGNKKARVIFSYRSKKRASQHTEATWENKPTTLGQYSRALPYTAVLQEYQTHLCVMLKVQ